MALDKTTLDAYIQALYDDDGQLSSADYQLIINFILSNGEPATNPRDLIQVRRGDEADLPTLAQGELAFTLDTNLLFIGGLNGNVKLSSLYSVKAYGAKGDGVTDDTAAIQLAIDSIPVGSTLYFPVGDYLLDGTGNQLIFIDKPMTLVGCGSKTKLLIGSTVPATTDVFRISPSTLHGKELSGINGFLIEPVSGTPARHGFHFDVTNVGQYISKYTLANNYVKQLGGRGVKLTNPTNTDGFFTSTIRDNLFYGGMEFERIGDSVYIVRNTMTGTGVGVEMTAVSGAVSCYIGENNITCSGGSFKIESGQQVKLVNNQCEMPNAYTGTVAAMIYIGTATMAVIEGNNMNPHSNVDHAVRVNNAYRVKISKNAIAKPLQEAIRIDAGANKTAIHYDNYFIKADFTGEEAPTVLDAGIGTIGVIKELTLQNSYTGSSGSYFAPSISKDTEGNVRLYGRVTPGTRTAGTVITNLPVGYRPEKIVRLYAGYYNFTSMKEEIIPIIVEPTGNVSVEKEYDTSNIGFDGLTFKASY